MAYLLDTNIFIQAKNDYYGFDLCPGFWTWLEQQNEANTIFSIGPIQGELIRGEDQLSEWAREQGTRFFLPFDQDASTAMGEVSQWVQASDYYDYAKSEFLSVADPLLVAYAKAHGHTVVTHEVFNPTQPGKKKIKIPAACHEFDVPYIRTFEMLREEGASFVLA
jgi:hypothetical protein